MPKGGETVQCYQCHMKEGRLIKTYLNNRPRDSIVGPEEAAALLRKEYMVRVHVRDLKKLEKLLAEGEEA